MISDSPERRKWSDIIIDFTRDALTWILDNEPRAARSYIERWLESDSLLLRRLGLFGLERSSDWDADERLGLLGSAEMVFEPSSRPETLGVLLASYGDASEAARSLLLAEVQSGPPGVKDATIRNSIRYVFLSELLRANPGDASLLGLVEQAEAADPTLSRGERYEAPGVIEFKAYGGPRSPKSQEDLLAEGPKEAAFVDWILEYEEPGWEQNREGLLSAVGGAVRSSFEWSVGLLQSLANRGRWDSDLVAAIILGWRESTLAADHWRTIIHMLMLDPKKDEHAYEIAELLQSALRSPPDTRIPSALLDDAEGLGRAVWAAIHTRPAEAAIKLGDDPLGLAINRPAGKLALFFVMSLSERRSEGLVKGIPSEIRGVFSQMVEGAGDADRLGAVVLASQAHFLHSIDIEWARACLLPSFDWNNGEDVARRSWQGFLTWGRLAPLLVEDLLPMYERMMPHLEGLERERHRFAEQLAVIALRPEQPVGERGYLDTLVINAKPEDVGAFTRAVTFELRELPSDVGISAWGTWMREYWTHRVESLPRPMSKPEAREILGWALVLPPVVGESIPIAISGPTAGTYDLFFHDLGKSGVIESTPDLAATLLTHALRGQVQPFYHCTDAAAALDTLLALQLAPETTSGIREQLLRLGCL